MGVECNVTPLGCCSNSIRHPFGAIITPHTDFDFYGVLQQHSNFNSVVEMFSSICNMLRISASACSVITLQHSLLMQPRRAILQSFIYHILQLFMGKSRLFQLSMHAILCLPSFCGTRKEVRMEIHEVLSFYHSRVKYVTLQELLANNTRSLIRDSKKIAKKSRVIKSECQV